MMKALLSLAWVLGAKNGNRTLSALALFAFAGSATRIPAQSTYTPYAFTNFAGMPGVSGSADGTGTNALFSHPYGVAVGSAGNVYVADGETIRKVTPGGVVTTLAGLAGSPGSADGIGSAARFNNPTGVAVDGAGNVYVADTGNDRITKGTPEFPLPCPCVPHAANATATVVNGFVVGANFTDGGCGYTNTPAVRIIGGGGSGAQAVAVVSNEVVVAVNILDTGSGYANTPVMVIAPPFIAQPKLSVIEVLSFGPLVTPVLELDLGSLSPYENYQLEFAPAAGGAWSNLGSPFTPAWTTSTQYVTATGSMGFLRVKYVP